MTRGQLISLDLVGALIVCALAIAVFILLFVAVPSTASDQGQYEILFVYENLDAGLSNGAYPDFFHSYRVDAAKLNLFADANVGGSIDSLLLAQNAGAQGIGLTPEGYDTCLYITDTNGNPMPLGARRLLAVGQLRTGSCDQQIRTGHLCSGYTSSLATFRPVLWDDRSPINSRIVQLNVVACKA